GVRDAVVHSSAARPTRGPASAPPCGRQPDPDLLGPASDSGSRAPNSVVRPKLRATHCFPDRALSFGNPPPLATAQQRRPAPAQPSFATPSPPVPSRPVGHATHRPFGTQHYVRNCA